MSEPTLTAAEREALQEARGFRVPTGGMSSVLDRCEREVERIKAEAVDRERAAWATKMGALADEWTRLAGKQAHPATRTLAEAAHELRALLAADDTEDGAS